MKNTAFAQQTPSAGAHLQEPCMSWSRAPSAVATDTQPILSLQLQGNKAQQESAAVCAETQSVTFMVLLCTCPRRHSAGGPSTCSWTPMKSDWIQFKICCLCPHCALIVREEHSSVPSTGRADFPHRGPFLNPSVPKFSTGQEYLQSLQQPKCSPR